MKRNSNIRYRSVEGPISATDLICIDPFNMYTLPLGITYASLIEYIIDSVRRVCTTVEDMQKQRVCCNSIYFKMSSGSTPKNHPMLAATREEFHKIFWSAIKYETSGRLSPNLYRKNRRRLTSRKSGNRFLVWKV